MYYMSAADKIYDLPIPMAIVGLDGRISAANESFSQLINTNIEAIISRPLTDFLKAEDNDVFTTFQEDLLNKNLFTLSTMVSLWINPAYNFLATATQIEEGRLLQLSPCNSPSMEKTKYFEFLSGISHQIRTPMNGVLGIAELLSETNLSSEQAKYVEILSRSGHALVQLLNELHEMSSLAQDDISVSHEPIELAVLAQDAMDLFAVTGSQRGIDGRIEIEDGSVSKILTDVKKIHQILVILLGNAFRYCDRGHVTLSVGTSNVAGQMHLKLMISDTGVGIEKARLPYLFQSDDDIRKAGKSYSKTGLGLMMCQQLVQAVNGAIDVESSIGQGTKFTVTVPVEQIEAEAAPASQSIERQGNSYDDLRPENHWNILIAEDNPVNQMLFKKIIERAGHTVTVVSNGQEAVAKVQIAKPFDLILMDISMPIMDGLDATSMIRSLFGPVGNTPILALTAHAMDGDREKFINAGMDGYQSKPVDPATLMRAIATVMNDRPQHFEPSSLVRSAPSREQEQLAPPKNEPRH
jgi:signal transduction histidine kinase/DNA-binding NarL/FixJ family response regulator